MKIREFFEAIASQMPISEPWDCDGVNVDLGGDVGGVYVALDLTSAAIDEAIRRGANLIVTHHTLIFNPLTHISQDDSVGKRVIKLIQNGISHISLHTRFDNLDGGVNDALCDALGLKNTHAFLPFARLATLENPCNFNDFCQFVEHKLSARIEVCGDMGKPVHKLAVLAGGGKDYVRDAVDAGADTFLTGEMSHAAHIDCAEYGINFICAGHRATEAVALSRLKAIVDAVLRNWQ